MPRQATHSLVYVVDERVVLFNAHPHLATLRFHHRTGSRSLHSVRFEASKDETGLLKVVFRLREEVFVQRAHELEARHEDFPPLLRNSSLRSSKKSHVAYSQGMFTKLHAIWGCFTRSLTADSCSDNLQESPESAPVDQGRPPAARQAKGHYITGVHIGRSDVNIYVHMR